VRHRVVERLEQRNRADLLRSVLEAGGSAEGVAASLGLAVDAPYAVLGFESVTTDPITHAMQREPLLDLVTLGAELLSRRAASTWTQRGVYVLVPVDPRQPAQRLVEFAASIIEQSERALRVPTRAAVGSTVPSLRDAVHSRWEVDQILRVLAEDPRHRQVATMTEVRSLVILAELREVLRERPHLRAGRIDVLRDYDARHATELVAALRAYLESFRNIPAAAEHLGLHENTYRYRLRKALDLSELNVDDPDERLVAELQLRLTIPPVL
jgi:DNA-binding PucR family transcriptional regulator